jgi:cytidyltransferase-like protein
VCAVGCFDLLHPGHIRLLEQARSLGGILVAAVESDAQARRAFGSSSKIARPVTPASERAEIVAALACIDCAVEMDGSREKFLETFAPDILVEGSSQDIPGPAPLAGPHPTAPACKVVRIPLEPGYSTAGLIERILQARS